MKPIESNILFILIINILVIGSGYILSALAGFPLNLADISWLSFFFSIITFIVITIFIRGQTKEPDSQTMHTLVSVSLKFLLELILALVWFVVIKKTALLSVLIFFVIYLTFTLFLIWTILKTLKNKSL